MPCNCSLVFRIALVACMAGVSCITLTTAPRTSAAASLTWYWQNPLPRAYSMSAIACPTANACVTVGQGGSIITTTDGGHHWTSRRSGTTAALFFVACPSRAVCYTVGSTKGPGQVVDVLLKSVDGGATWSRPSQHVSLGALLLGGPSLVCPTMTTCLLVSWVGGTGHILRTADGGRTWRSAHDGEGTVTCPTTHICYAASGHMLFRSVDAGATWTTQSKVPGNAAGFLGALACPAANTCLVALGVCLDCGDADALHTLSRAAASAQEWVDLFLTRDGGKTWRHVDRAGSGDARSLACGSATTCYASGSPDVLETVDGGQTWSAHPFPVTGLIHEVTCPGATTCYAAADFTALKTTDGFRHILQTPATSRIGGARLAEISCPTAATCYANTFAAEMVTTADAGKTWTVMPGRPMNDFRCPTSTSCYGFVLLSPGRGKATQALFFRSSDGAKTWQQFTVPVQTSTSPGVSAFACVAKGTCYVLATTFTNARPSLALFRTTNGGATWSTRRSINSKTAPGSLDGAGLACPSASTCFVALGHGSGTPGEKTVITFLATTNAGKSWTAPSSVPCTASCPGSFPHLVCPTVKTCYVMHEDVVPSSSPTHAMVTHDAGATWHSAQVSRRGFLSDIACPNALACRIVGSSGIYGTEDGGLTWRKQAMNGRQAFPPNLTGIACPSVDTCYAVGGEDILATHPPRILAGADLLTRERVRGTNSLPTASGAFRPL